jgi:glycosyltransferase involved in cell wall biosynthesis
VCVISRREPCILVTVAGPFLAKAVDIAAQIVQGELHVTNFLWWSAEEDLPRLLHFHRSLLAEYGRRLSLHYLCNTTREVDLLRSCGMPAIHCNHNAFIDLERVPRRLSGPKAYDAVYNAAFHRYKRHHLARDVERLILLGYGRASPDPYELNLQTTFRHAHRPNYQNGTFRWLSDDDVYDILASARVGLCLSRAEGAMYASVEYLLCGLPIVTTASIGGRDEFFDEDFVTWVEDSPRAVADGVRQMCARTVCPEAIRNQTIGRMENHRRRFVDLVERIGGEASPGSDIHSKLGVWPNRLVRWLDIAEFAGVLNGQIAHPVGWPTSA